MISSENLRVFYLKISEFMPCVDSDSLAFFSEHRQFTSEKRKIEHTLGRFLLKTSAKFLGLDSPKIEIVDNKPFFKNSNLEFSISHSIDFVMVAFYKSRIGIDIEAIIDRDFSKLAKRYSLKDESAETFYSFWTEYESSIKLQGEKKSCVSFPIFDNNYYFSACSSESIDLGKIVFQQMKLPKNVDEVLSLKKLYEMPSELF